MVELIFEYMQIKILQCVQLLDSQEIVLSSKDDYLKIKLSDNNVTIGPYHELLFNQGEGDTKVILNASKILDDDPDVTATILSFWSSTSIWGTSDSRRFSRKQKQQVVSDI